jgi:DNA polymerase III delta prime subunit
MQGEYTKINTDIVKLGLYQLEQYKLNEQVIQKIIQLEEKDFYRNIDFLKKSGKLGEA